VAYTLTGDLLIITAIVVVEALGWAMVNPSLYAIVASGSPIGRSSTAQGVFGTAGTLAYILSSLITGRLFATDLNYPFYLLAAVVLVTLVIALAIAGRDRFRGPIVTGSAGTPDPGQPRG
jgi:MFS family permease